MTSYRHGQRTGYAKTRVDDADRMLGGRAAVAHFAGRHVAKVRRFCQPVACDVATRAMLYDVEQAVHELALR